MSDLWDTYTPNGLPDRIDVDWLWQSRMPLGLVSFLGGSAGVGKSALVWALALSVATGRPLLDAEVTRGRVLLYDFDSEPSAQGVMLHKVRRGLGIKPADIGDRITYRAPSENGAPVMDDGRLAAVAKEAKDEDPALIIIDAWTSAFWNVRSNDTEQVAAKMAELRTLAKTTKAAVLVIDHAPKPVANGPGAVERGLIGSTMKMAGSRAAYLLSRVPPKEVDGRDVSALHTLKNNLGPLAEPVGIERTWHQDAVTFAVTDLPEEASGAPGRLRAQTAIREALDPHDLIAKADLVRIVAQRANVQTRTIEAAVAGLITAGEVEADELPHDRRAKGYRLASDTPETPA